MQVSPLHVRRACFFLTDKNVKWAFSTTFLSLVCHFSMWYLWPFMNMAFCEYMTFGEYMYGLLWIYDVWPISRQKGEWRIHSCMAFSPSISIHIWPLSNFFINTNPHTSTSIHSCSSGQCTSPFYWGLTKPGWYMWKCWTDLCTILCSCAWCRQEDTREDRGSDFSGVLHDACSSSIEEGKPATVSGVDKDSQAEILSGASTFKFSMVFYALLHSIGSSLELRSPATANP